MQQVTIQAGVDAALATMLVCLAIFFVVVFYFRSMLELVAKARREPVAPAAARPPTAPWRGCSKAECGAPGTQPPPPARGRSLASTCFWCFSSSLGRCW